MISSAEPVPLAPAAFSLGLRALPLAPVVFAADRLVQTLAQRHPAIFVRLGAHAGKRFLIDPTDLPFVFLLAPQPERPTIAVARSRTGLAADARIAGPFAALLGLMHGAYDGDALFFSRDLVVEGDIEAVLALRNALDDAQIDLIAEAAAVLGPFAAAAERIGNLAAPIIERLSGLALTRTGGDSR